VALVAAGLVVFVSAALLIFRFKKPGWLVARAEGTHEASFADSEK